MSSNNPGVRPPSYTGVGAHTFTGGAGASTGTIAVSNAGLIQNNTIAAKGTMHLKGPDADLVINGNSLNKTLDAINSRLAILQPKPELLDKYENLREAYEHYKTLEKLLTEYNDDDK